MVRKKILFFVLGILFPFSSLHAQYVAVSPAHLVCDYEVSEKVDNQVKLKLQKALTACGISSEIGASRFAMVPEIAIIDERTKSTVPTTCEIDFNMVISLKDIYTGKSFASISIPGQGVSSTKMASISKGVAAVRLNSVAFNEFCANAVDKMVEYYEANLSSIIAAAKAEAKGQNFQNALSILAQIPEGIPGFDTKVAPVMQEIYLKMIDVDAETVLNKAKAAWAQSPNEVGAAKVAEIMADFPSGSSFSKEAASFMSTVRSRVQTLQDKQLEFERKQAEREYALANKVLNNEHAETMASINAARSIGLAWAQNQPRQVTKVYLW